MAVRRRVRARQATATFRTVSREIVSARNGVCSNASSACVCATQRATASALAADMTTYLRRNSTRASSSVAEMFGVRHRSASRSSRSIVHQRSCASSPRICSTNMRSPSSNASSARVRRAMTSRRSALLRADSLGTVGVVGLRGAGELPAFAFHKPRSSRERSIRACTSSARKRAPRPIRTTSSSPRAASRFTVRTDTPSRPATSLLRSSGCIRLSAYAVPMRPMEPERDRRREMPRLSSPSATWRFYCCPRPRGGFVYVHATGIRAHVHVNDAGDVDVAGWDGAGDRHFPDREAFEVIVASDLQRLRENDQGALLLLIAGFDEFRTVGSYRGRKKKRDSAELERLLQDVEREGVSAAAKLWDLSERRMRELRRVAEKARRDRDEGARSPSERADWHRDSLRQADRIRRDLQAHWERQQPKG